MEDRESNITRNAELRVIATRALARCCADCLAVLREQLIEEEFRTYE